MPDVQRDGERRTGAARLLAATAAARPFHLELCGDVFAQALSPIKLTQAFGRLIL